MQNTGCSSKPVGVRSNYQTRRCWRSIARPLRVWNGIFAAGDRRLKRDLKSMSPRRDRKLETTTREKSPQKTAFLVASCQLRVSEDWVVADAVERNWSR